MLRTALSPLRFVGWRAVLVAAIVAGVYAAAMVGNGFWGYAAASEISSGECTTSTTGQETCITRFCQDGSGGQTHCTTYTTTCSAPDTQGQRRCFTATSENSCGSDKTDCRPIGNKGKCTSSSGGYEQCKTRTCSADGQAVVCRTTTVSCGPPSNGGGTAAPPPTTGGTRPGPRPRCTYATGTQTCTSDPRSCGMGETGKMIGRVREEDGTPIQGADVRVLTRTGTVIADATTRRDGLFTITDLQPAGYRVRYEAEGHRVEFFDNKRTLENANAVRVPEGGSVTASAKLAVPFGRLTGEVRSTSRAAIEGATVEILDADGDPVTDTTTNAKGAYRTQALPVDEYLIRFSADGFAPEYFNDAAALSGADPVETVDGKATKANARLTPSP